MTKDLLFGLIFLMNIGAMVYVALDSLRKDRKRKPVDKADEPEETSAETSAEVGTSKKAGIGKSKFSIEEARKRAYAAVDDYLETLEEEDVEFDEPATAPEKSATLSKEDAKKAFETDQRIAKEIADSDHSMAEPIASGSSFDELARAEVILGRKTEPTVEEHKYVVRVFADFKDTQLMTKLPQSLLDKLAAVHKKVEELGKNPDTASEKAAEKIDENQPASRTIKAYAEFSLSDILPKSNN